MTAFEDVYPKIEFSMELEQVVFRVMKLKIAPQTDLNRAQLQTELEKMFDLGLELNCYSKALDAAKQLRDVKKIQQVGRRCLKDPHYNFNALCAFRHLGDRKNWLKAIAYSAPREFIKTVDLDLMAYLGKEHSLFIRNFHKWSVENNFGKPISYNGPPIVNMASKIASKYDVGVGIAKDGIFLSYVFNKFGLPTTLVDCHRKGNDRTTFCWIGKPIAEKQRVAVFDVDTRSGRTSERVLNELQIYKPKFVDLVLMTEDYPVVSDGYRRIYTPRLFSYTKFEDAWKIANIGKKVIL